MDSRGGPERAGSLVVELAARTVIVDGTRVELPPTEFSLLAVLAARPGEVVTHKELLEDAFGDSAYMDIQDLHWRIWNIRKLIGDADRKIIRNRRGVGFVLESRGVEVLEGVAATRPDAPTHVIRLEPEEAPESETVESDQSTREKEKGSRRPFMVLSPAAIAAVVLVAGLVLGGSWLAGYTLSQTNKTPTAIAPPQSSDESTDESKQPDRSQTKDSRKRPKKNRNTAPSSNFAVGTTGGITTGDGTSTTQPNAPSGSQKNSQPNQGGSKPPPPPPQPNAQLYHLFNSETGDHIMTTSSSVANQKQAEGYSSSNEGGVFTSSEKGTAAISLDSGTAYVYESSGSAPQGVSVAPLYRLSGEGDFFYTSSSATANQAEAQGWSRTTVGYVAT